VESVLASIRADKSLLTRRNKYGETILHHSVENTDLCRELLDLGADVNAVRKDGNTALFLASFDGCIETIKLLLKRGADLNILGNDNWSALIAAAYMGDIDCCILLIENGADLMHYADDNNCALDIYDYGSEFSDDGFYIGFDENIDLDEIEKYKKMMCLAFENGQHPSQVQRRLDEKWNRRWPFMNVISGCQIIPLLYKQELPLPIDVKIPDEILDSKEKKYMNLLKKVLGNKNLARIVVSFL
jgi:hypothetical protein